MRCVPRLVTSLLSGATLAATAVLTGCAGMQTAVAPTAATGAALSGRIVGGQPAITGARVYLFAAGTTGYTSASTSLLTTPNVDAFGNGYVFSDANGNFSITGGYTCPSATTPVYLLAQGGNPGLASNTSNNAINLMAALKPCGSLLTTDTVVVNEVTTAATITALQRFMSDPTHIGAPTSNSAGISASFATAVDLVNPVTGSPRATTALGNGTIPSLKLNTLGDILAPCVNSASNTSSACTSLFTASTPPSGTAPTEIAGAMLLIARNAGQNPIGLFQQTTAASPFQPMLTSAPNDFTLGVTYSGGALTSPGLVAIDAAGDAWVANCPSCNQVAGTDSLVGFGPQGAVLTGATGYRTGIHMPQGIGFDPAGNLWSINLNNGTLPDQVIKMSPGTGAVAAGFPYSGSTLNMPLGIALDANSNAWVTNFGSSTMVKIGSTGTTAVSGVTSPGFSMPLGIGIDGTGLIYAAGSGSSSILKFDANGTVLSGSGAGYTGAGISNPISISIDNGNRIWTIDNGTNAISEIFPNGTPVSPSSGFTGGIYQAAILSIAGDGTVWLANCRAGCPGSGSSQPDNVLRFGTDGTRTIPSDGYQNTGFSATGTSAIDGSGNLWVSNNTGGSVTKLIGIASPVKTPLAVAAATNSLGVRP